jgi:hypothetical protein
MLGAGIAALGLLVSMGAALAAPAVATDSASVRSGPGSSYGRVARLYPGEEVEVTECRQGWCFVKHAGTDGWVSSTLLANPDNYDNNPPPPPRNGRPLPPPQPGINFGFTLPNGPSVQIGVPNQPPARPVRPNRGPQVCFYRDVGFSGPSFCARPGESADFLADTGWNDRISSIEVLGGASVDVYEDANYEGRSISLDNSASSLGGMNDMISSYEVH